MPIILPRLSIASLVDYQSPESARRTGSAKVRKVEAKIGSFYRSATAMPEASARPGLGLRGDDPARRPDAAVPT
jgi:hypothetical protein